MKVVQQSAVLTSITQEASALIERCGRIAYQSFSKYGTNKDFINLLKEKEHLSVLEHAGATIDLVTDRGVSHELVRHRIASFTQESTRYVNYKEGLTVIEPPGLTDATRLLWTDAVLVAEKKYQHMLEAGLTPQIARSVLPTCLKTEIAITANFREWLHIFKLRLSKQAHPQMRQLIELCQNELIAHCPEVFK